MDPGEYDVCTYCGRSIFPGVAECPYCHHYTDGEGPLGLRQGKPRSRAFAIAAWLVVLGLLVPLLWALVRLLGGSPEAAAPQPAPPQAVVPRRVPPRAAVPPPAPPPPVCLLTGFEPFGGAKTNASWEMLKPLAGQTIAGYRIVAVELPVVYDEVAAPLQAAVEQHRPTLVICFGVGTPVVQVELVARNGYHPTQPKDNRGRPSPRRSIVPGGPAELPTQLPAPAILQALEEARIGAADSRDAGGYLCNECFYRLMALTGPAAASIRVRGFVHVPPAGTPDPAGGVYTLEKLQRAVRLIVEQTAMAPRPAPDPLPALHNPR